MLTLTLNKPGAAPARKLQLSLDKGSTFKVTIAWECDARHQDDIDIHALEARNDGHEYLLIDILEQDLNPNTGVPPRMVADGDYADEKTRAWAELIGGVDAFIFVTPEYNASIPGPMKDAYDLLFAEWTGKPIGFIGYGSDDPAFWISPSETDGPPRESHIAFTAADRATVDAFFAAAVEVGAEVLHEPKEWPEYHEHYYGAFVRDPDGNNVEAVSHVPARG